VHFQPPAAATSLSGRCFRAVAHFRRYGCHAPPASFRELGELLGLEEPLPREVLGDRVALALRRGEQVGRPDARPLTQHAVEGRADGGR
jgi:hypothetical protein